MKLKKKTKKPDKILKIVKEIVKFNEEKQQGLRLKNINTKPNA